MVLLLVSGATGRELVDFDAAPSVRTVRVVACHRRTAVRLTDAQMLAVSGGPGRL